MDWKECINKRIVKSIKIDTELINSLIKNSKNKLESESKLNLDETTADSKVSLIYDSLRELLEALSIKSGYKIYNHEAYTSFLKEIIKKSDLGDDFDKIRTIRNSINYYGKSLSLEEARRIINEIKEMRSKILKILIES